MLAYIIGVVLFALGIGIAVALHEAGHMLTAKMFGMKVRRFFIGFGPRIWSFRRGETEYGLKIIPAGGFCDIAGMTALDEVTPDEAPRAMWRYPVWKRVVVLVSGSLTHFILGFIILYVMAVTMGLVNLHERPIVGSVAACASDLNLKTLTSQPCKPGDPAPAKDAGLQPGDEILSVAGQPVSTFPEVTSIVQKSHGPTRFVVDRDGKQLTLTVDIATVKGLTVAEQNAADPHKQPLTPIGMIGATEARYISYNGLTAFGGTTEFTGAMFQNTWEGIKQLPNRVPSLISAIGGAPRDPNSPMSVVGASRLGGQAVEDSQWAVFWLLLATLQFFLGVFNLLPLLPLDGGHIAVALYERVRNWLRSVRGRPAGGPVDYTKLAPLTLVVVFLGGAMVLLSVTADIVNPISLTGQ
ncbi:MAG TPA: site-2 protease family protein [Pseudonocardiaceae bacterium]|nr:site-2 protease family protein [Pseudonocardiaceae bacterium]